MIHPCSARFPRSQSSSAPSFAALLGALALLLQLSLPVSASAQSIAQHVHVGLRSGVLDVSYGMAPGINGYGSLNASLGLGGTGAAVGYAFDEHWLATLGATVSHAFSEDPLFVDSTSYSARPGLAYVLGDASHGVRPVLGAEIELGRASSAYYEELHVGPSVSGGLQIHLTQGLSLDPMLSAGYLYQHMQVDGQAFAVAQDHAHMLGLRGWLGLSAWL